MREFRGRGDGGGGRGTICWVRKDILRLAGMRYRIFVAVQERVNVANGEESAKKERVLMMS